MMFVFIGFWWQPLRRVVLVAIVACKDFFFLLKCIKLLVYFEQLTRLVMLVFECSCDPCRNVTPLHRLLVVVRSLRLVVLVFKECELCWEMLLYVVGCLFLCNRYDWPYWFSKNVLNFTRRCYSML